MAVQEGHSITCRTGTRQTCPLQRAVIIRSDSVIERRVLHCEVKRQRVPTCFIQMIFQSLGIAIPELHHGEIGFGRRVVIIDMTIVEALAVVITETIHFDNITQPFQICFEHRLYIRIGMIPITRSGIVGLVTVSVIRISGCRSLTSTRCRGSIHLICAAYIRTIGREGTVLSEIVRIKITPTLLGIRMVDHDIRYHACTVLVELSNQFFQLGLRSPVAIQIAIVHRVIARTTGCFAHRRQPNKVEPLTDLLCTRTVLCI